MKAMDILQGPRERLTSQVQKGATVPLFILSSKAHFGFQVHSTFAGTGLLKTFFLYESNQIPCDTFFTYAIMPRTTVAKLHI
jgi:hypothetical protein